MLGDGQIERVGHDRGTVPRACEEPREPAGLKAREAVPAGGLVLETRQQVASQAVEYLGREKALHDHTTVALERCDHVTGGAVSGGQSLEAGHRGRLLHASCT
jgi:hypothetical protein